MTTEKTLAKGRPGAGVILGALVVAAAANLAVVLALGGYETSLFGLSVRSHTLTRPLVILLVMLALRWLVSAGPAGLRASLGGLTGRSAAAALVGAVVFLAVLGVRPPQVEWWMSAAVGAAAVLGFVFAWLGWRPPAPAAARLVVAVVYLAISAGLAGSLSQGAAWGKRVRVVESKFVEATDMPADRTGLLAGNGVGVAFRKTAVENDWRNAAVVAPGGFFSRKLAVNAGDLLKCAVARTGKTGDARAVITAVAAGERTVLWDEPVSSLDEKSWREVAVPLSSAGQVDIVFELDGPPGEGAVLFANPRIRSKGEKRTNFIFIVVDALRADRLGLYGYERDTSPEIDALAADAVIFDDCIMPSSFTLPSMSSILTSLYPAVHGLVRPENGLTGELEMLSERFLGAGYSVGAVQVNSLMQPGRGVARGFAEYFIFPLLELGDENKNLYVSAEVAGAKALEWLERHSGEPFFLYLHYMDVHDPYEPPGEFRTFGDTDSDLYDGSIAFFSRRFGELFEKIRQKGLLDDTVIVLTGDHGEQFLEHGFVRHQKTLYSEEIRVPLVFWLPGRKGQLRVSTLVGGLDLAPTFLEMASLEPLREASGRSLAAALTGAPIEECAVYSELVKQLPAQYLVALSRGPYRFIQSDPDKSWWTRLELYDLEKDPGETTNLAGENHELAVRMRREVGDFISTQAQRRARLVKETVFLRLTEEEEEKLRSLGYLAPGQSDSGGAR